MEASGKQASKAMNLRCELLSLCQLQATLRSNLVLCKNSLSRCIRCTGDYARWRRGKRIDLGFDLGRVGVDAAAKPEGISDGALAIEAAVKVDIGVNLAYGFPLPVLSPGSA